MIPHVQRPLVTFEQPHGIMDTVTSVQYLMLILLCVYQSVASTKKCESVDSLQYQFQGYSATEVRTAIEALLPDEQHDDGMYIILYLYISTHTQTILVHYMQIYKYVYGWDD